MRFDINISQKGFANIKPFTVFLDTSKYDTFTLNNGFGLVNYNEVGVWIDAPADTDTGFTYRQTGGDAPAQGRMQFKVTGIKKSYTITNPNELTITNPAETDNTKVLQPNGDGTATFNTINIPDSGPSNTDELTEGTTNLYYTEARVSANADVVANTAKNDYPTVDATKLAGIEDGATADQTGAEIKALYEAESNTNAFTDAEKTQLTINTAGLVGLDTDIDNHTANTNNPHSVTAAQIGLDNVENKSSADIRSEIVEADIPLTIARTSQLSTSIIYQEAEIATGDTWINGKPIYRTSFQDFVVTNNSGSGSTTLLNGVIEQVININLTVHSTNYLAQIPVPFTNGTSVYAFWNISSGNLLLQTNYGLATNLSGWVEYTKQ